MVMKRLANLWWPTRSMDVQQWVATCKSCAYFGPTKRSEPIKPILTFDPFDMLGIDFIGPLDLTSRGNRYILHVVDYFTRFSWAYALPDNKGGSVERMMEAFFQDYQTPLVIYPDRESHFIGKHTKEFWKRHGILHIPSPAASPTSTRMVEKHNGLLEERLRRLTNAAGEAQIEEWDRYLKQASKAINTRDMRVYGYSPFQLLFGVSPNLRLPSENPMLARLPGVQRILAEGVADWEARPEVDEGELQWFEGRRAEWRETAREKRIGEAEKTVSRSLRKLVKKSELAIGDLVMLLDSHVRASKGMKLHGRWNGPFRIVGKTRGSAYIIQHPHAERPFPGTHHRDCLKLYIPRPPRLQRVEEGDEGPVQPEGRIGLRRYQRRIYRGLMGLV